MAENLYSSYPHGGVNGGGAAAAAAAAPAPAATSHVAAPLPESDPAGAAAGAHNGGRRTGFQRFSNTTAATNGTAPQPMAPTPPSTPSTAHGGAFRHARLNSDEQACCNAFSATGAASTAVREAATTSCMPSSFVDAATDVRGAPVPNSTPPPDYIAQLQRLPPVDFAGTATAPAATRRTAARNALTSLAAPTDAAAPAASHGVTGSVLTRLRHHLAHTHGLSRQPVPVAGSGVADGAATATQTQKEEEQQQQPLAAAVQSTTSSSPSYTLRNTRQVSQSGGDVLRLVEPIPVVLADDDEDDNVNGAEDGEEGEGRCVSASLIESDRLSADNDLHPEVAEACHTFLHHLPQEWSRSLIRAVTLQTATLQVPQRLLRAPAIFDAYAELKGEVTTTTPETSKTSTSAYDRAKQLSAANTSAALLQVNTVDLQRLLTVGPALLRYRLHNARAGKISELRTGFRGNAQTAGRTEASINRYAYVPHVQRDVHFGAMLAQGVARVTSPGPRLPSPLGDGDEAARQDVQPPEQLPSTHATATAAPSLVQTFSAASFEGLPSIFLKDRYDLAQSEGLTASGGGVDGGGGAGAGSANNRQGGRRRRHVAPFFERELVAALASGQEDAALFATTLAPELMVGMPSFLKHPERAVPLSIAAALHHLYTAISVELFMRAYTSAAASAAAAAVAAAKRTFMEDVTAGGGSYGSNAAAQGGAGWSSGAMRGTVLPRRAASPLRHQQQQQPATSASRPLISLVSQSEAASAALSGDAAPSFSASPHHQQQHQEEEPHLLRGPALELGVTYVRNTIVCSACTPGMETYVIFLNQIVYPNRHGTTSGERHTSGHRDAAAAAAARTPPPCRAVVQLSEEANGSMAPPAMPPPSSSTHNGSRPPGHAFDLPTVKHAAVELTQLVTWVQDERSHDPRHGQPFLCDLTFVPTYIPDIAAPTLANLCQPLPGMEPEDSNTFPCVVVQATLDLWKALPPPEVSNLLRVCYVLDRHAQRVMELESPDYATEEMLVSAAVAQTAAAAAAAAATGSGDSNRAAADGGSGAAASVTKTAIAFPDLRVRQHVDGAVAAQVRAYLEQLSVFGVSSEGTTGTTDTTDVHLVERQHRLLAFFMARLRYYEAVNERHCKTEEALQREELQRLAQQRAAATTTARSPASPPTQHHTQGAKATTSWQSLSSSPAPSSSLQAPPQPPPLTSHRDVYAVRGKPLCDALAAVLAFEARVCGSIQHCHGGNNTSSNNTDTAAAAAGGRAGGVDDALNSNATWLRMSTIGSHITTSDMADVSQHDEDATPEATSAAAAAAAAALAQAVSASVVVLLVPQRDVQRR